MLRPTTATTGTATAKNSEYSFTRFICISFASVVRLASRPCFFLDACRQTTQEMRPGHPRIREFGAEELKLDSVEFSRRHASCRSGSKRRVMKVTGRPGRP